MSKIAETLDNLAVARMILKSLEDEVTYHIPADLQKSLNVAKERVAELEKACKVQAKHVSPANRHTLKGLTLQLVYSVKRTLDKDKTWATIVRLGGVQADMDDCFNSTESWSIRERGKGK